MERKWVLPTVDSLSLFLWSQRLLTSEFFSLLPHLQWSSSLFHAPWLKLALPWSPGEREGILSLFLHNSDAQFCNFKQRWYIWKSGQDFLAMIVSYMWMELGTGRESDSTRVESSSKQFTCINGVLLLSLYKKTGTLCLTWKSLSIWLDCEMEFNLFPRVPLYLYNISIVAKLFVCYSVCI